MSSSSPTASYEALIAQAEQALRETDRLCEELGIDPADFNAYVDSITTPEIEAEAKARFDADMQAIKQEVREALKPPTRTSSKRLRQMI